MKYKVKKNELTLQRLKDMKFCVSACGYVLRGKPTKNPRFVLKMVQ